jgi:3-deoxy-manno-octulosonate cytidylyltransferase (CMP-KDO synthetase)
VQTQVVIPVRFDSGRLPGKALLPLAGKPILQHVLERCRAADLGPSPIVATDDARIADAAQGFGAPVAWTSPAHTCGCERVAEVARGLDADLVINVQGDEALLDPAQLHRLPELFADPAVEVGTPVSPLPNCGRLNDASLVKAVLDDRGDVLYFSRSPIPFPGLRPGRCTFYGHVGVYAFRRPALLRLYGKPEAARGLEWAEGLEQLRVLQAGGRIRAQVWPAAEFGINTPDDLERARRWLSAQT